MPTKLDRVAEVLEIPTVHKKLARGRNWAAYSWALSHSLGEDHRRRSQVNSPLWPATGQISLLHISSPTGTQTAWTQPQHTLPFGLLAQNKDSSWWDETLNSYRPIGADRSERVGSTGKEVVASNKKHSNVVLAFLLPRRKERLYSVVLQRTGETNYDLLSTVLCPHIKI